jgi:ammonia channel protein AmtB
MMTSSALVLLMIPALCLFYSGASDRYSALILFRLPLITTAFVGVQVSILSVPWSTSKLCADRDQWYLWGYTLTFSPAPDPGPPIKDISRWSWYGGDTRGSAFQDVLARPVGMAGAKIPELVYALYHGMFGSFTCVIMN